MANWDEWSNWGGGGGCAPPAYPPPSCQPPSCPPYPAPVCVQSPCPPVAVPPCPPPWYGPPRPPWYPGANGGVAFGSTPPQFPIRGHFFWDGTTLYMWDGVEWQDIGPTAPSAGGGGITDAPMDGQSYVRKNGTWVPLPSGYVKNIVTSYYMSSQTILIPAGATEGLVVMWGSTGGSGGVTNADSQGTGAGGYLEKMLTGLVPGNTLVFTLGAAGAAGAIAGNGGNAGTTTLTSGTQTIGTLTCNGSAGGGANYGTGETLGGTATGGDVNIQGQAGSVGTTANYGEGSAGMTFYSQGANGVTFQAGSGPGMPGNPGGLKITWVITG